MTEEVKDTAAEEVAKELEGKSPEELKALEDKANAELRERILNDACTYVWNLIGIEGQFDKDAYTKYVTDLKEKNAAEGIVPFSRWDDEMYALNQTIITQGYGNFGKEFVEKALAADPESAKVLFEAAIQSFLDIRYEYEELINSLMMLNDEKMKSDLSEQKNTEENK